MAIDVQVINHGSLVAFRPISTEAKEWFEQNVQSEGYQWMGHSLMVDHRYAGPLIEGIVNDGLEVQ